MKALIVLSLVQTALLVYLVLGGGRPAKQVATPSPVKRTSPTVINDGVDEQKLRQVVRDEIRSDLAGFGAKVPAPKNKQALAALQRDSADEASRRDQVEQQIESYENIGQVSDAQMQRLEAGIGRLSPVDRKQMMLKLVRAINAQEIKGRL